MTAGFDGQRLRHKRKAQRLSLVELGSRLGVTHQAVSRWERGETRPDIDLLPDIATVLRCSIDDLYTPAVGATP